MGTHWSLRLQQLKEPRLIQKLTRELRIPESAISIVREKPSAMGKDAVLMMCVTIDEEQMPQKIRDSIDAAMSALASWAGAELSEISA